MTALPERSERLSVLITALDSHGRLPLYVELVERARRAGLAGATVLGGVQGFGHSSLLHRWHLLSVGDDVPIEVTIVESSERIDEFLADTADLLEGRVVMRRAVQVVLDRARPRKPRRP